MSKKITAKEIKQREASFCLPWPAKGYRGLYIEMKMVANGFEKAKKILWSYLEIME